MAEKSDNPLVKEMGERIDYLEGKAHISVLWGIGLNISAYFLWRLASGIESIGNPPSSVEEAVFRSVTLSIPFFGTVISSAIGFRALVYAARDFSEADSLRTGLVQPLLSEQERFPSANNKVNS